MRPGKECSDITIRDPDYKKKYATDRALENLPSMLKHFGYEMKGRLDVESEVSRKLTSLLFDYPIREDSSPTRPSFSYLKERVKAKYGA